jgi:hypothetical protein
VVLTTWAEPCDTLVGYYEDRLQLLEEHAADPDIDEQDAELAERWFPSELHDTLVLGYSSEGELVTEYDPGAWSASLSKDRMVDPSERLYGRDGPSVVTGLDPATGEGEATMQWSSDGGGSDEADMTFWFDVPSVCNAYLYAKTAYEDALPDGCRSVSCR